MASGQSRAVKPVARSRCARYPASAKINAILANSEGCTPIPLRRIQRCAPLTAGNAYTATSAATTRPKSTAADRTNPAIIDRCRAGHCRQRQHRPHNLLPQQAAAAAGDGSCRRPLGELFGAPQCRPAEHDQGHRGQRNPPRRGAKLRRTKTGGAIHGRSQTVEVERGRVSAPRIIALRCRPPATPLGTASKGQSPGAHCPCGQ